MWDSQILAKTRLYEPVLFWADKYLSRYSNWPSPVDYNSWSEDRVVSFIAQEYSRIKEFELQYEPRIYLRREVLTRSKSWHDLFNALVWMSMPKTKVAINTLHYQHQMARKGVLPRSSIENKLTHFDECGAVIVSKSVDLLKMIAEHRWVELFWDNRDRLSELYLLIIGHATYEALLAPYIGLTTKTLLLHHDPKELEVSSVDSFIGENLASMLDRKNCFAPFPILGMPGVFEGNEIKDFYLNINYFRPNIRNNSYCMQKFRF